MGDRLQQDPADSAMVVHLRHPDAPGPVTIELVGITAKSAQSTDYLAPKNTLPLPRLVIFTPRGLAGEDLAVNEINKAWFANRKGPSYIVPAGWPYPYPSLWNALRVPLFDNDGVAIPRFGF
jgi:hypothetical protein